METARNHNWRGGVVFVVTISDIVTGATVNIVEFLDWVLWMVG